MPPFRLRPTVEKRLLVSEKFVKQRELNLLRNWFNGFCSSFRQKDPEQQRNIALKVEHTGRVCSNIRLIAGAESLDDERSRVAEAIALLHDVGRFPQYHRFRTFKDSESVNHAELAADILVRAKALDNLAANEQDVVIEAVRLHNAFRMPPEADREILLYLKLIRDADKLDIWRVFMEFYRLPHEQRASAVALGFPDLPQCSSEALAALSRRELVDLSTVKTLNDFKLLQLSWVYDLNFTASFALLRDRDYIDLLGAALPGREDVQEAVESVKHFAEAAMSVATIHSGTH